MDDLISSAVAIADTFCKKYPQAVGRIKYVRLTKGCGLFRKFPNWPHWCFLPSTCWMLLFMDERHRSLTPGLYQTVQQFSVLATWRYSKVFLPPSGAPTSVDGNACF